METRDETKEKEIEKFSKACTLFLDRLCISDLRSYGRDLGVARPTVMKKEELTEAIIGILTGQLLPVDISNQGAPVKNDYVDTRIPEKMEMLRRSFMPNLYEQLELRYRMERVQENKPVFFLHAPGEDDYVGIFREKPSTDWEINPYEIYRGQVERLDGEYYIFPLDGNGEQIVSLSLELVQMKKLREGDIVSYRAFQNRALGGCATEILTVNAYFTEKPPMRPNFDECISFCSTERIHAYRAKKFNETANKLVDWLFPICMGQRGCVIAPPKAGKSTFLRQIAQAVGGGNEGLTTYVLLINQPMDVIYAYSECIPKDNLFYTVYDEEPERHVFTAEFVLKRIKRMVENGENVCLFVDSLTELARAYNETETSSGGQTLPCGLEEKTVSYAKNYFSTAKYLMRGGSLTMLSSISAATGDPADELLVKELLSIANYQIFLTDNLAKRRIYPAVDYLRCGAEQIEKVRSKSEQALDSLLREELIEKIGNEGLIEVLKDANTRRDFVKALEQVYYAK